MVHCRNKRIIDALTSKICDMVYDKCVDAVGISVLFDPKADRWEQLRAIMDQALEKLNCKLNCKLNSSSERRANSADSNAEPPAWKGQSDGHYIVVWNSQRLVLTAYKADYEETPKIVKYLQFQQAEWPSGPSLRVYHDCSAVRPDPVDGVLLVSVCSGRNAARTVPVTVGII